MQLDAVQRAVAKVRMRPAATEPVRDSPSASRSRVTKIRDRHHTIAKLVASDLPKAFICKKMGLSWNTLDLLINQTPAFAELIAHYRPLMVEQNEGLEPGDYMDVLERTMVAAELEIADRLAEEPEKLSISELHKISRDAADRLGFSKHSINLNVNITLAERLEGLRRRSRPPAGAGDRGGVSSAIPASHSAPPLLELKAGPENVVGATVGSNPRVASTPHQLGSPSASPTQPPSEGVMSLREVLDLHGASHRSDRSRNPTPPDAATRAMSAKIRPRNTYTASDSPVLTPEQKINRRLR